MVSFSNRSHAVALTEDQLRQYAPSVFANVAHDSRSERFRTIPTIKILERLQREGFEVVSAQQCTVRDASRTNFTRHLLRMRHRDDLDNGSSKSRLLDTHGEIVLKNANDGSSSYELMAGAYRLLCSNGMVGWSPYFEGIKVRHSGNLEDISRKVIEGTYTVVEETNRLLSKRDEWSQIRLTNETRLLLAQAAHTARFGDRQGETNTPIKPEQLLTVRRSGDSGNDLWTYFNIVQENCIKGGLSAYNRSTERMTTTREVKSLDNDVRINRALWKIADNLANLIKSAA